MSITKIKESELSQNGIASLSTHPALPSLYEGRNLSAAELRAAFDKLPRLLAERFNALIDSLELYDEEAPPEKLSAAIATELWEGHSLADLFRDIQSGAFYEYVTTDGTQTLAACLEAFRAKIALPEGFATVTEYVDAPSGILQAGETRPVSGAKIAAKISEVQQLILKEAENRYRLAHVNGDPLTLCLEVYHSSLNRWDQAGVALQIPADAVIKSGTLATCEENGIPDETFTVGDKYLDLVLAGETESHVYVKVSDLVDTVATEESGNGDIVTGIRHEKNKIIALKTLSSDRFATQASAEALDQKITAVETVSATKSNLSALDLRVCKLEAEANGGVSYFQTENGERYTAIVPEGALPYAALNRLSGSSACRNLFNAQSAQSALSTLTISWDAVRSCIVLNGTAKVSESPIVFHIAPIMAKNRAFSFTYRNVSGRYTASEAVTANIGFYSGFSGGMPHSSFGICDLPNDCRICTAENVAFYSAEEAPSDTLDTVVIELSSLDGDETVYFENYGLQMQVEVGKHATPFLPYGWHHTAVTSVDVTGKNLLPETVFDTSRWSLTVNNHVYPLDLTAGVSYVISIEQKENPSKEPRYLYLQKSNDNWQSRMSIYILANADDFSPLVFTAEEGYSYRLYTQLTTLPGIRSLQLEVGDEATAYEPYRITSHPVPAEVQALECYGMGIGTLCNYVDFESKEYVQNVGWRDYAEGDFESAAVITDGIKTLAPLPSPIVTDLSSTLFFDEYLAVTPGVGILFENGEKSPVKYKITYQVVLT